MIVTIVDCAGSGAGALTAENLAWLAAREGRKVLLLDASTGQDCDRWGSERVLARLRPALTVRPLRGLGCSAELERLRGGFDDIVILVDGCGGQECRWALIAAQVAVVPLAPADADIDTRYDCISRLNSARMFHPGLRVLFVTMAGEPDPTPAQQRAVRAYVAEVMAAGLAATMLHLPALSWRADAPGRCACDVPGSTGAAEMAGLYREVYRTTHTSTLPRRIFGLGLNT